MAILVAALAAAFLVSAAPVAQGQAAREHEVKAAFLYNFTKFVEWPADAFPDGRAPIIIAVLGPDPFGRTLDDIVAGKQVNGRPLVIKRLAGSRELERCHVLFVSPQKATEFTRLLPSIAGQPTLTVGETDRFAEMGGMIQFVKRQRKVRFRINPMAASQAGLKISSRLLNLAEVVGPLPNGAQK